MDCHVLGGHLIGFESQVPDSLCIPKFWGSPSSAGLLFAFFSIRSTLQVKDLIVEASTHTQDHLETIHRITTHDTLLTLEVCSWMLQLRQERCVLNWGKRPLLTLKWPVYKHVSGMVASYASPTSGEAYRDRRLTTNFELWVEFFCVPTCFHKRIPKPCLSLSVCLSICPYPEKRNHHSFVNISPTLVIDTSMERSSRVLRHGHPKIGFFFSKKFEIRILTFDEKLKSP